MIARFRFVLVLICLLPITILLLPIQFIAVKLQLGLRKKIPLLWHRLALKLVGMNVVVKGNPPTHGSLFIVANHVSWTDIPVMGSIMELCFIAKQEVDELPGARTLARMQRTVFVKREEKNAVGEQVNEITQRILAGDVMVLFGEGSTGDGSHIGEFKSSLLGAAQYAITGGGVKEVIIQPVSIAYTGLQGMPLGRFTRSNTAWCGDLDLAPHALYIMLKSAWDVEVTFGEPIRFDEHTNRRKVASEVREQVRNMFVQSIHQRGEEVLMLE